MASPARNGNSSKSALKWVPLTAALDTKQSGIVSIIADNDNKYPCRRCLQDARADDEVLLLSYDPFFGDSPYRGASPIFVHAKPCDPYQGTAVPEQQRRRLLSVRAYDVRHMMTGAEVVEGSGLEDIAAQLFEDPEIEYLHVHNAKPGCFAVRIERA